MKRRKFGIALGASALAAVVASAAAPSAVASSTESGNNGHITGARLVNIDVSQIKDFSGWNVEYWGPGYSSGTLDASVPANRDMSRVVPEKVRASTISRTAGPASTVQPNVGFLCTLYVGQTYHNGSKLEASTAQTCTGNFINQWTAGQFDRSSWTGWRTYGGVIVSDDTYGEILDTDFWITCGSGGTYDYALSAIPWAVSSDDGTTHSGPLERGKKGRYTCGT